jgi:nicotinamidase-related amidase
MLIAGLWTETCVALVVVQAIYDGYQVYVVEDCCGDISSSRMRMRCGASSRREQFR